MFKSIPEDSSASLHPIPAARAQFDALWRKNLSLFWTIEAIQDNFADDIKSWERSSDAIKRLVRMILLLFGPIDKSAMAYSGKTINAMIDSIWVNAMLTAQSNIEAIHADVYGRLNDFLFPSTDRHLAEKEAMSYPPIQAILSWARECEGELTLDRALVGAICVEGVILQTFFAPIYALKNGVRNHSMYNGITTANELIARDENLHVEGYIAIFKELETDGLFVADMLKKAVKLACDLIDFCLPDPIPELGLYPEHLHEYSQVIANRLSKSLGQEKIYDASLIPEYITIKDIAQFASFHTIRPTEYIRPVADSQDWRDLLDA